MTAETRAAARRPAPNCAHGVARGADCTDCAVARDRKHMDEARQRLARSQAGSPMLPASPPVHAITPVQRESSVLPMLTGDGRVTVATSVSSDEPEGMPSTVVLNRWDAGGSTCYGRYRLEEVVPTSSIPDDE